ncbi:MAG: hypothetical protein SGI83_17290 [Bacteroidota bacterium]|nr:hypothetical protein [Bacteroidota bacterium]
MKKNLIILLLSFLITLSLYPQKWDMGFFYGRFWSPYKYIDYGKGYLNQAKSNYNFFPSFSLNKYYSEKVSFEGSISFTLYEQYYSTRKYIPAFESSFGAGHFVLRGCYSFIKSPEFECRIKGGIGVGVVPDMYKGEYVEMFVYPIIDSISRGNIKRNFTPVFPMLSGGLDISYKIAKRLKISLAANYQKGFIKITEYDIYYNDGSGNNDQRAKQWGTGDFYGIQFGLRYLLRDKDGQKF